MNVVLKEGLEGAGFPYIPKHHKATAVQMWEPFRQTGVFLVLTQTHQVPVPVFVSTQHTYSPVAFLQSPLRISASQCLCTGELCFHIII